MAAFDTVRILSVHHWNDTLFSFTTTREPSFRFESGHFVMIGLPIDGKPLLRAYSIASPSWEEHLEFLSIKVQDGALTKHLQNLKVGDELLVGRKPTGTLVVSDLLPAKRLFLFGSGTGLAPFMSIIRDPETYERFDQVILVHGVRLVSELAYRDYIGKELLEIEGLGEEIAAKLLYYPTVTREEFANKGRITTAISSGVMCETLGIPPIDPLRDRAMICGSPEMLKDTAAELDKLGFEVSAGIGQPGDYVIERAFVER
ncbi:ferredoxin--NADP reductase [Oxalicibacterium faecigallinarum]|uniref:ferredoxin--NADP(+) reductase n=1 Tax=Oxalicibacterium faecigallinarum TaxID=573741 RepID=A0A8J3AR03_9BURK|nr:ferredoxin--NADP reductase [Oxalicibacterium faecigallinarum]GGI18134.1 ferredoxin--NADP(+) reductase [Oxalicibacterium faecigallinarum]